MPATKKRNRIDKSSIGQSFVRCKCLDAKNSIGVCELDLWHGVSVNSTQVNKYGPLLHRSKHVEQVQCSYSIFKESMYFLLSRKWVVLLSILCTAFVALIFVFAVLLWLCDRTSSPDHEFTTFLDLSLQTISTIGYGHLSPHTTCANWVVVAEAFTSMFGVSFIAGIAFAKFAKPRATLLFSQCFTICNQGEDLVMQFRVLNASRSTNASQNEIYDAWFRVTLVRVQPTLTGTHVLCSYNLQLEQTNFISLRLEANLTHVIDASSPFYGLSRDELLSSDFEIYIVVSGVDSTLHDTIHDQHIYRARQLRWGERFNKVIQWNFDKEQLVVDYAQLSETTPEACTEAVVAYDGQYPYWTKAGQQALLASSSSMTTTATPSSFSGSDQDEDDASASSPSTSISSSSTSSPPPHWQALRLAVTQSATTSRTIQTRRRGNSTFLEPLHEALNSRQHRLDLQYSSGIDTPSRYSFEPSGRQTPLLESQKSSERRARSTFKQVVVQFLKSRWKSKTHDHNNSATMEEQMAQRHKMPKIHHANRKSAGLSSWVPGSLYYKSLDMSWTKLMILIVVAYFLVNALFAGVAVWESDSILNFEKETKRFDSAFQAGFFFSVQTLSTLGFGTLSPNPNAYLVNVVVFVEALLGIAAATIITGVTWAKFSIPQNTTIMFSKSILFTTFHGKRCMMFRAGNTRVYGDIIESTFKVAVIMSNPTTGEREYMELNLVQDVWPIFKYCSTVIHIIDSKSPLHGLSLDQIQADKVTVVVLFTGLDTTLDDSVYARRTYVTEEISNGQVFQDNVEIFRDMTRVNFDKLNGTHVVL